MECGGKGRGGDHVGKGPKEAKQICGTAPIMKRYEGKAGEFRTCVFMMRSILAE